MIDFIDMIMNFLTWLLIVVGLTFAIVFLGMTLSAFLRMAIGG
jgi:hypothetical protein